MSCWFPAAGCTRVQASRCDAGVEKPVQANQKSRLLAEFSASTRWWRTSGGDDPSSSGPLAGENRLISSAAKPLAARYRARAAWTDSTQLDFRGGGGNLMKEKSSWGAPPAWGRSDAAEQTNLSLHARRFTTEELTSCTRLESWVCPTSQAAKKRKQSSAFRRLTAAIFRGCHPWRSWFCGGIKKLCHFSRKLSGIFYFIFYFFWIHWKSSWSKSAANYMNTMENCWESANKAADV